MKSSHSLHRAFVVHQFLLSLWQLCDWQGVSALLEAFCLIANDKYHGRIQRDFSALQVYG
jgi:hypothetical protein